MGVVRIVSSNFQYDIVLAELLLGKNCFSATTPKAAHANILGGMKPDFSPRAAEVDESLRAIIARALECDREARFSTAREMMSALELHLYRDGYGPTNEKLAAYLRDFFALHPAS